MSLITRCPACTTMFKVVPDQLRVSDGWVRCGQCNEVFDANENLQDAAGEAPKSPAQGALDIPVEPFLEVNPHALHIDSHDNADAWVDADVPLEVPIQASMQEAADAELAPSSAPTEHVSEHSFMRAARSPSRWSRTWVRVTLSLACLVLVGALFAQVVIQERDRIVAMEPSSRRLLDPMCGVLGCNIAPLRQIESVVIDSSSFTKVRGDVYRLSVTLKNTAPIAVAIPDLELTLTDMQDQPVVRRVISAVDFAKQQIALDSAAEILITLPVGVKLNAGSERVSGYRLLSFYP